VISISKEKSKLKGIIKLNGDRPLSERMIYMKYAEFFISVSSGLAWLNWALGKKTVMISGFTDVWNEFKEDNIRIINKDVCHACYNSQEHRDKLVCFHYTLCPENLNFECTRKISPKMVMDKIIENNLI
jgi:autotransporter strand-loop-strand O-heptosyltransferase